MRRWKKRTQAALPKLAKDQRFVEGGEAKKILTCLFKHAQTSFLHSCTFSSFHAARRYQNCAYTCKKLLAVRKAKRVTTSEQTGNSLNKIPPGFKNSSQTRQSFFSILQATNCG